MWRANRGERVDTPFFWHFSSKSGRGAPAVDRRDWPPRGKLTLALVPLEDFFFSLADYLNNLSPDSAEYDNTQGKCSMNLEDEDMFLFRSLFSQLWCRI